MGFVIWYKLVVSVPVPGPLPVPPLPLMRASNDVFGGEHVLDADIEIPMSEGEASAEFSAKLHDLPAAVTDVLKAAHAQVAGKKKPLQVEIQLGYFDDLPLLRMQKAVLVGALTRIETSVGLDGKLVTELRGRDLAAWKLLRIRNVAISLGGISHLRTFVRQVLDCADVSQQGVVIGPAPCDYLLKAPTGLAALGEISRLGKVRFSVRDEAVHWQTGGVAPPGPPLNSDNIVKLDDALSANPAAVTGREKQNEAAEAEPVTGFAVSVLGDAALRPGQTVPVVVGAAPPRPLHVHEATHRFSTSAGYTVDLVLSENGSAAQAKGPHAIAHRMRELVDSKQDQRPAINVGTVAEYEPGSAGKHLATLNFGQSPGADVVAPSVETPVSEDVQLHHKPIASPFAWHKCGLIVPAYPGQRALLAHNRSNANDAVVSGYLWSEHPSMERPKNEPGDWWLCLPTQVVAGRPMGKGVNDLTDAEGHRVIQAKGLKVDVGNAKLASVGDRPAVPSGDELVIDHAGGTTVKIASDGSVEIATQSKTVTLTNGTSALKLDGPNAELTNGTASLKLSGPTAELSNGSVKVALSGPAVAVT